MAKMDHGWSKTDQGCQTFIVEDIWHPITCFWGNLGIVFAMFIEAGKNGHHCTFFLARRLPSIIKLQNNIPYYRLKSGVNISQNLGVLSEIWEPWQMNFIFWIFKHK